jgi:hypothetical protein
MKREAAPTPRFVTLCGSWLFLLLFCTPSPATAGPAGDRAAIWPDYQVMIWQPQTPARLAGLARLGITAGKLFGERGAFDAGKIREAAEPLAANDLRWYVENIATDFYSAYHRWRPGRPVNWLFDEVQRLHREEPDNIAAFTRTPSLSDPDWLRRIAQRLEQNVRAWSRWHPLYYSLADEAGIADLGAAWDFDFDSRSLAGMRQWLRQRYRTLGALNREWGTAFPDWDAVEPMTTDAAIGRVDENYAAWADFKEWMDVAFARAVRAGTDAVHRGDGRALGALEGAQIPGWGGYDYSRLGGAADVIEMYDSGNNVEIARSLFPKLIVLMTAFGTDPEQIHRIWHELLLGGGGAILWDEDNALVGDDGAATARGRALGDVARELRSGLAAQLIASSSEADPVAILYSPESFRIQWLLDRKTDGKPWAERRSETEAEDNAVRAATRRAAGALSHLGVQPRWLTMPMIERGALQAEAVRVLILPHAIALSPDAAKQIRAFAAKGRVVVADVTPGEFDSHGRRQPAPLLAEPVRAASAFVLMEELSKDFAPGDPAPVLRMRQILERAGIEPRFTLSGPDGAVPANIDARAFHDGRTWLIGLQRDWSAGAPATTHKVRFNSPVYVYDLRHPGTPAHGDHVELALKPVAPAVFAIAPEPLPAVSLTGPSRANPGTDATFALATSAADVLEDRVVHIEVVPPDGTVAAADTTNMTLHRGRGLWRLALPLNAAAGTWTIRIRDVVSGQQIDHPVVIAGH